MASYWLQGVKGGYQFLMTDGYLRAVPTLVRRSERRSVPLELIVAERLYANGKRPRSGNVLDPLHIWVIGTSGWESSRNRLAIALAEGDPSPHYRAAIIGCGQGEPAPQIFQRWARSIERLGWEPKPHPKPGPYVLVAGLMMQDLLEHYVRTGVPTVKTFTDYSLPVTFCGDDH